MFLGRGSTVVVPMFSRSVYVSITSRLRVVYVFDRRLIAGNDGLSRSQSELNDANDGLSR